MQIPRAELEWTAQYTVRSTSAVFRRTWRGARYGLPAILVIFCCFFRDSAQRFPSITTCKCSSRYMKLALRRATKVVRWTNSAAATFRLYTSAALSYARPDPLPVILSFYHSARCVRLVRQDLIENKSKFVLVHASSGHKRAVEEILSQPTVQTRLADTKASDEIRALATFFDMLKKDPERAYYGYNVSRLCASTRYIP